MPPCFPIGNSGSEHVAKPSARHPEPMARLIKCTAEQWQGFHGVFWQAKQIGTQNVVLFQNYFHCNLYKTFPYWHWLFFNIIYKETLHGRATCREDRFKLRYNPILSYLEGNRQQHPLLQWIFQDPLSSYRVTHARTEDCEHLRRGNTSMLAHPTSWVQQVWNLPSVKALCIEQNGHFLTGKHPKITQLAQQVPHAHHPVIILIHKVFSSTLKMRPCQRHFQWQHCTLPVKISVDIYTLSLKENAIYS